MPTISPEKSMRVDVPGLVRTDISVYQLPDGEVWETHSEWTNRPRAGWRATRFQVFRRPARDAEAKKTTMTALLKKLEAAR